MAQDDDNVIRLAPKRPPVSPRAVSVEAVNARDGLCCAKCGWYAFNITKDGRRITCTRCHMPTQGVDPDLTPCA